MWNAESMAALPAALACQPSRPARVDAAARVPVSNVSEDSVPPNGISMWVCGSTPPGMTSRPDASMTRSAETARSRLISATVLPSIKTSAW